MGNTDIVKGEKLRQTGNTYPRPERIKDPLFLANPFFDSRDLLQVRYEMVRRVDVERQGIAKTARDFGVTRPTFYQAQQRFRANGIPGLLRGRSGPKGPRKVRGEILTFLDELRTREGRLSYRELSNRIQARYGQSIDPSTILRALRHRGKKQRPPRPRKEKRGKA